MILILVRDKIRVEQENCSSSTNEKSQKVRKAIKVFLVRRVSPSRKAKVPLQALAMKIESTLQRKKRKRMKLKQNRASRNAEWVEAYSERSEFFSNERNVHSINPKQNFLGTQEYHQNIHLDHLQR